MIKRFHPSFETHVLALTALALYLRQGWLTLHPETAWIAAGCQGGADLQCRIMHYHDVWSGSHPVLTALFSAAGIYACLQCFCGRVAGLIMLALWFALQIPVITTAGNHWYFFPGGFNVYYLHPFGADYAGINALALILCLNAIGRMRNAKRR